MTRFKFRSAAQHVEASRCKDADAPLCCVMPGHADSSLSTLIGNVAMAGRKAGRDCLITVMTVGARPQATHKAYAGLIKRGAPAPSHVFGCMDAHLRLRDSVKHAASIMAVDGIDSFRVHRGGMVSVYNSHDVVFAYSKHSKDCFEDAGVRNVEVMPLGVDGDIFKPIDSEPNMKLPSGARVIVDTHKLLGPFKEIPGVFVFSVLGMMQKRKGCAETIQAYLRKFSGRTDVLLWIHGRSDGWGNLGALGVIAGNPRPAAPILWTDGSVSDEAVAQILSRADCYVSAHKLEGFGLVPLQAMACGTPCIITDFSGPRDYANSSNCLLLPSVGVEPVQLRSMPDTYKWAIYRQDDLCDLMGVAESGLGSQQIVSAGLDTAKQWTWQKSFAVLSEHCPGTIKPYCNGNI